MQLWRASYLRKTAFGHQVTKYAKAPSSASIRVGSGFHGGVVINLKWILSTVQYIVVAIKYISSSISFWL